MAGAMHGHGRRAMDPRPKIENPGKLLWRVAQEVLKNYAPHYALVLVCIVVSALVNVQVSVFLQTLMDDYIAPMLTQTNPDFQPLFIMLCKMACLYAIGILCGWLNSFTMAFITQGTLRNLRVRIFSNMQTLPISYFDTHAHGDIMSVYTNDVDTLRQLISTSLPQMLSCTITIVTVFVNMCRMNLYLTGLSIIMILVQMSASRLLAGKSSKYFVHQQADLGAVNGFIEEMMEGQKVVKVFTHEDRSVEDFCALNEKLRVSAFNANGYANMMMPINGQLGNISYALCAVVGAIMITTGFGGVTVGTLVAFLALNKSFGRPITEISMQANNIIMALAGAKRIFDLLDTPSEEDEGCVTLVSAKFGADGELEEADERTGTWAWKYPRPDGTTTYTQLKGDIRFDSVDFTYDGKKTVLHDINLFGLPGEKIAFVGSTGAGKTTITNLINRFYDIADGKIRYDGINIRKIKKADLRRSLGIVLQETNLFTGTVMENIRYGRLDATDEECIAAAQLANADSFIERLPDGYNTMLTGNGANLSQGQRQLLAIARAAVADPPVLILDEATSSIDTRTEELVQKGMDGLMYGRTTFVIAHRLSTVRNSDCILVLEQGRVIERGSHDELLKEQGRYYQLYTGNAAKNSEVTA